MDEPLFYIAPAILFMVLALPLYFKWIPPNHFFGYRISHAFKSKDNWYFLNRCFARINFITLGTFIILITTINFLGFIDTYEFLWFYLLLVSIVFPWLYVAIRHRKPI